MLFYVLILLTTTLSSKGAAGHSNGAEITTVTGFGVDLSFLNRINFQPIQTKTAIPTGYGAIKGNA